MAKFKAWRLAAPLAGLCLLAAAPAHAGGLQVSPVTVTLTASETADALTLGNAGARCGRGTSSPAATARSPASTSVSTGS